MKIEALEKALAAARDQSQSLEKQVLQLDQAARAAKTRARQAKAKLKSAKHEARQARAGARDAKKALVATLRTAGELTSEIDRMQRALEKAREKRRPAHSKTKDATSGHRAVPNTANATPSKPKPRVNGASPKASMLSKLAEGDSDSAKEQAPANLAQAPRKKSGRGGERRQKAAKPRRPDIGGPNGSGGQSEGQNGGASPSSPSE